ncbi:MAG: methylenetetrahydrofolate reductase [NAD(P)H] [Pseudomonadota bacterium]
MADLKISFEFFPPRTPAMHEKLWGSVTKLAPLNPEFVSVTYGAGGSTRERTHETVARIIDETSLPVAAHLTCVNARREDVDAVLKSYWDAGVRHIVALRGDPPDGVGGAYEPFPGGYANAAELTAAATAMAPFEVSVGCYPEKHPESASFDADIDMLKRKVDAGATRAISQFFYNNSAFLRYLDRVRAAGIDIPIAPGIMPVTNFGGLKRMAGLCGASVPTRYGELFENMDSDPEARELIAASLCAEQCLDLAARGVDAFHFYTLNRDALAFAICRMLGVRPAEASTERATAAS